MKRRIAALLLAAVMAFGMCACGSKDSGSAAASDKASETTASTATETTSTDGGYTEAELGGDFTLRVGMDCAYAPYCWTQDDDSNGAVKIADTDQYVCGYDVEIAKMICEKYGWNLEIVKVDWDGIILALNSNKIDCIIDGMGVTEERLQSVNFSNYYWSSEQVMVVRADSKYADAHSLEDFAGAKVTSQLNSMWIPLISQIPDVVEEPGLSGTPELLVAVSSGKIDGTIMGETEAISGVMSNPDLKVVYFDEGKGFDVDISECSAGIAVRKTDGVLLDKINAVVDTLDRDKEEEIMNAALKVQPLSEE